MFMLTYMTQGAVTWGEALNMTASDREEYLKRLHAQLTKEKDAIPKPPKRK